MQSGSVVGDTEEVAEEVPAPVASSENVGFVCFQVLHETILAISNGIQICFPNYYDLSRNGALFNIRVPNISKKILTGTLYRDYLGCST